MQRAQTCLTIVPAANADQGKSRLEDRSDDELMLLSRGGLDSAFDILVRRHQRRALSLASRYLGNSTLAADVAQNAFVALLQAVPSYRASGKFTAFFYRILINQCRMGRRRARRFEWLSLDDFGSMPAVNEILVREQRRDAEQALSQLNDKFRDAVLLRFGAQLSYEEVAQTLGVPVGTAKRRVFVAMARLREILDVT